MDGVWYAQRDATARLDAFEKFGYATGRNLYFYPAHTTVTLDKDLYGSRSKENQVKKLSTRKANKEGQRADVLCDALFRVTLEIRF